MSVGLENFWSNSDPPITNEIRDILVQYSGIPESDLVRHVAAVRDEAWKVFKYPCVGLYAFVRITSPTLPVYDTVLQRLKAGQTLLDLGCCVGQETRKLVFDGAPAENITGMDLEGKFIEFGYDLFKDEGRLSTRFYARDIFASRIEDVGGRPFDMIMAVYFFHLFDWSEQVEALTRAVHMLKPEPGSMIFGAQFGREHAQSMPHSSSRSGNVYGHNPESWSQLVQEAAETSGLSLDTEARLGDAIGFMNNGKLGTDFRWLLFSITVR